MPCVKRNEDDEEEGEKKIYINKEKNDEEQFSCILHFECKEREERKEERGEKGMLNEWLCRSDDLKWQITFWTTHWERKKEKEKEGKEN